MKYLKKYSNWLLTVMIAISCGFVACKKENLPVKPQPFVNFTAAIKNSVNFTAAGGRDTIVIKAGTDGWWVTIPSTGSPWCAVSQSYGSGDFLLPVTINANATGSPRRVVLTISPTYNLPPVSITLNQAK